MIRFRRLVAWRALFYWWGGVNRYIFKPSLMYLVFLCILTVSQRINPSLLYSALKEESIHAFGGFVVFLLVFRLNQCMARHNEGKAGTALIFSEIESLVAHLVVLLKGDSDCPDDLGEAEKRSRCEKAIVAKLNLIRLTIAWAVSFVLHWRLQEASSESEGEISEEALESIIFLYCRLQQLLYAEEMETVDRALSVYVCRGKNSSFRTDINRHFVEEHGDRSILGDDHLALQEDGHGQTTIHLPKVVMMLVLDCASIPIDLPWGYPQRILSFILQSMGMIMDEKMRLDTLITMPLPLAYLQHCRVLLSIFAFCHPFSIDPQEGLWDNIIMPFFLFWAIMGFEVLAEMMENPLGDDETDINTMAMIHSLEVCCEHAFEMSESRRRQNRQALLRPFRDFGMTEAAKHKEPVCTEKVLHFEDYFHWLPVPTLILSALMENHGNVDAVHLNFAKHATSWTTDLRHSARHIFRKAKRRGYGHPSHPLTDNARGAYTKVASSDGDDSKIEDGPNVVGMVMKDPNYFFHYLSFAGVLKAQVEATNACQEMTPEMLRRAGWKERVQPLLHGTGASSLLNAVVDEDTERSVICNGPIQRQHSKCRQTVYFHSEPDLDADMAQNSARSSNTMLESPGPTAPLLQVEISKDSSTAAACKTLPEPVALQEATVVQAPPSSSAVPTPATSPHMKVDSSLPNFGSEEFLECSMIAKECSKILANFKTGSTIADMRINSTIDDRLLPSRQANIPAEVVN